MPYDEAMESKKDVLQSQYLTLKMKQHLKNYNNLRKNELKLKLKMKNKIISLIKDIKNAQSTLPSPEMPEEIREMPVKVRKKVQKEKRHAENLESELEEIQEKLRTLQ
jgi:hypothetical protein